MLGVPLLGGQRLRDATALTAGILAALGFTYTRTGEVYGRRSPGGPGNYVRHATNGPELDFTEVDGKNYPSLIVRGAATPLISYSADLTNAAWTKTNCTAELVTGSLESAAVPNGHSLVTATANNATVTCQLTRASALRNTRWKIKAPDTNVGDVLVSHGKPDGAALYEDDFSSDTSGEWTRGYESVDGTIAVVSGSLVCTKGASDGNYPTFTKAVTGLTAGRRYNLTGGLGGTRGSAGLSNSSNFPAPAEHVTTTPLSMSVFATGTTLYIHLIVNVGTAGDTATLDDVALHAVEETTLTPGEFHDIELGEYTGANPFLAIRLTDDGDTVEHYDVQMAELAVGTPVPNFVPQGATPTAVGAAVCSATLSPAPIEVDYSILAVSQRLVRPSNDTLFEVYADSNNRVEAYDNSTNNISVRHMLSGNSNFAPPGDQPSAGGAAFLLDVQASSLATRSRLDQGTWGMATPQNLPTLTSARMGRGTGNEWGYSIVAFRDNNGQLLGTPGAGFNISAIKRYEASL